MTAHRSGSFLGLFAASASAALVAAAFVTVAPISARAQDAAAGAAAPSNATVTAPAGANQVVGDIDNGKFQVQGRVTANAVYVRSGPSDNDYPTMKLDSGATVTFVGAKFDWLKILPPEGSFCYVAKAFVEKRGDGKVGRVTNTLNVRVGSSLNPMKTKVAAKLEPGTDVEIIGDKDEYFTIKPPKDVYLYVAKQFVEPVSASPIGQQPGGVVAQGNNSSAGTPSTQPSGSETAVATGGGISGGDFGSGSGSNGGPLVTEAPTTAPSGAKLAPPADTIATDTAESPATQPSAAAADAEREFDQLEAQLPDVEKQPLDQQPLDELSEKYQKLAASGLLPDSMRRMAEWRVAAIKPRLEDKERFLAVKKLEDETKAKEVALQAEREELEQRIKATGVQYYTAVGTLRNSSLQVGSETLYRLTDPNTGRTLVYIRGNDPKLGGFMGQFVGVQGDIASDDRAGLKFIAPKDIQACDPSKVNTSITAQISPPSLLQQNSRGTASTGND